ncbi:MAG: hypothetical protein GWP06_06185 [Actinobacteria bacterium]|nr:hypothetical protein [Actinomycetota bacterium]
MQKISGVRQSAQKHLLKKSNVIGVGIGFKETGGKKTADLSLSVLVQEKVDLQSLAPKEIVPKTVDGIPTDVIRVGKVVAYQSPRERLRPAPPGASIGHYAITAGTFGAVVWDAATDEMLILSNNHVFANSNNARLGDAIIQPGAADGGRAPQDRIADLLRFVTIQYKDGGGGGDGGNGSQCPIARFIASLLNLFAQASGSQTRMVPVAAAPVNLVDAAVARPWQDSAISDNTLQIGKVSGTTEATIGMAVKKSGRTTGLTEGSITILDATIEVGYGGNRVATYEHQLLSNDMSDPGDSGSLLVDSENHAVGLLFAGSDEVTVFNPIDAVLSALNIKI